MIYLNCAQIGDTWQSLLDAGGWQHYNGVCQSGDVVIRWGANNERHAGTYGAGVRVLNKSILLDKYEQLKKMHQEGVRVPLFWRDRGGWANAGEPATVVTKRVSSIRGYGIQKIRAAQMFNVGTPSGGTMKLTDSRGRDLYYQEFIDKEREFRVMMVGESIAFVMEKTPPDDGRITWNEHQGSEWIAVADWDAERGLRTALKAAGQAAIKAIGYDFGAVDIMKNGRDYYVLEVNSKPQLGPRNSEHFVNAITAYLSDSNVLPPAPSRPAPRRANTTGPAPVRRTGVASGWTFCPYCAQRLGDGRGSWAFCPHCANSLR